MNELKRECTFREQWLRRPNRIEVAAALVGRRKAGRRRAERGVGRVPGPDVAVDARRDIGVHDRGQLRNDRRRVRHQVDPAAAEGAIGLGVIWERLGGDVLAADQRGVAIQHPKLAVLVFVALVIWPVGAQVIHPAAGRGDLLHDPPLLVADPARRRAFQQDLHRDASAGARRDQLAQPGILEGVALEADAAPSSLQKRFQGIESVIGRDERSHGGRLGHGLRREEALQIPAGIARLAAVDDIVRVLRPVSARVRVKHGPAGGLVKLAVEDLALFAEGGGWFIGHHGRALPARTAGGAPFVHQHISVGLLRVGQGHNPAGIAELQRAAGQIGHSRVGVGAVLAGGVLAQALLEICGLARAPQPGTRLDLRALQKSHGARA